MIPLSHDTLVWLAKAFGTIYLMILLIGITIYAYWPSNRRRFEQAGESIFEDEDRPCR